MPPLRGLATTHNLVMPIHGGMENEKNTAESYLEDCGICGQLHGTSNCIFFGQIEYVKDELPLSRARQTLPKCLEITKMADGGTSVIARVDFPGGTTFGPLEAKRVWTMNPMNDFPIKVFGAGPEDTCHLDRTDEEVSNWMCFVSPASNAAEHNLVCYQSTSRIGGEIYYTAVRPITTGEELRVWYAPRYAQRMKMPHYDPQFPDISDHPNGESSQVTLEAATLDDEHQESSMGGNIEEIVQQLPAQRLGARGDKTSWNCTICSVMITSVIEYAKHLMQHYKPLTGVFCDICGKKFHRLSVLQKHKRIKHPDGRSSSEAVGIPTSGNQQQQNDQTILMNMSDGKEQTSEAMKDTLEKFENRSPVTECSLLASPTEVEKNSPSELPLLDDTHTMNVNDLLENSGTLMENASLKSILENQCLSMNIGTIGDSMLSDSASNGPDSSKFSVDEELTSDLLAISTEVARPNHNRIDVFRCDICDKKFEKADYLYRHLRKHTGEFICTNCLCVFARKENLLSHLCPASSRRNEHRKHECPYCQKVFLTKKYLKRHVAVRHNESNVCKWCRNSFATCHELETHKCQAPKHICSHCGKRFVHREHLTRHAKLHLNNSRPALTARSSKARKRTLAERPVICEKCGDLFKNPSSLKQHLRSHGERNYECDICHSKFHRIGVLQQHKSIHQSIQIPCHICGKKLKSKKALGVHLLLHGNRKFQCDKCDKCFFQRCNYLKHYKQMHSDRILHKCPHCLIQFTSELGYNRHVESHAKPTEHPCKSCHKVFRREYQLKRHVQTNHSGIVFRCPYCNMTARYRHSMRRHFERQHKSLSDQWSKPGFVNDLIEKTTPPPEQAESSIMKVSYRDLNNLEFEAADHPRDLAMPMEDLAESRIIHARTGENEPNDVEGPLRGEEILLRVSNIGQAEATIDSGELSAHEVPQLSISEAETNLAESVLGDAYIFGEDGGDIMFYVLENTPVIAEY